MRPQQSRMPVADPAAVSHLILFEPLGIGRALSAIPELRAAYAAPANSDREWRLSPTSIGSVAMGFKDHDWLRSDAQRPRANHVGIGFLRIQGGDRTHRHHQSSSARDGRRPWSPTSPLSYLDRSSCARKLQPGFQPLSSSSLRTTLSPAASMTRTSPQSIDSCVQAERPDRRRAPPSDAPADIAGGVTGSHLERCRFCGTSRRDRRTKRSPANSAWPCLPWNGTW